MDNITYTHMFLTFCEVCCARPTGDHEEQLIVEQGGCLIPIVSRVTTGTYTKEEKIRAESGIFFSDEISIYLQRSGGEGFTFPSFQTVHLRFPFLRFVFPLFLP